MKSKAVSMDNMAGSLGSCAEHTATHTQQHTHVHTHSVLANSLSVGMWWVRAAVHRVGKWEKGEGMCSTPKTPASHHERSAGVPLATLVFHVGTSV